MQGHTYHLNVLFSQKLAQQQDVRKNCTANLWSWCSHDLFEKLSEICSRKTPLALSKVSFSRSEALPLRYNSPLQRYPFNSEAPAQLQTVGNCSATGAPTICSQNCQKCAHAETNSLSQCCFSKTQALARRPNSPVSLLLAMWLFEQHTQRGSAAISKCGQVHKHDQPRFQQVSTFATKKES